jgi:DNA-directed RNA polymerase alpha subunit
MKHLSTRARFALGNVLYPDIDYQELMTGERIEPQDVAKLSARALMRLPNVGRLTVEEIRSWLRQFGMTLADDNLGEIWDR